VRANVAIPRSDETKRTTGIQYAALPYRASGETLEILLITSLRTRRWIIPKGWPQDGHEPSSCAALEALEEAGVAGEIEKIALGHYRYFKQIKNGVSVPCKVDVFALKVTRERKAWEEKDERERRWCTVTEAAAAVDEPQLRLLILNFGAQMAAAKPT
jgi:8-oxo-dGTP pyrophosphatase MutT (NUDIX family)